MSERLRATMRADRSVPIYSKQCRVVVGKMKNHAKLPNPPVAIAEVEQHLDELDQAEQDAQDGGHGTVTDRDEKLAVVVSDMALLIAYVEARANANQTEGAALIEGAGLFVVKRTIPVKAHLAAKHGKAPTTAKLFAKAPKGRAAYQWQMGTNGEWTDLPQTVVASTSVDGLTPGTIYSFRFRTLTVDGLSDWSAPITFIAH